MAKARTDNPNLFGDFKAPTKTPEVTEDARQEEFTGMNEPEPPAEKKKAAPKKKKTDKDKNEAAFKEVSKKRGRPKAEFDRQMKYVDMSGVESYVTIRAKQEGMFVSEFLRYLVMKDGLQHKEVFSLLVDNTDERVVKDLEKFEIKM